jgi:hypothetical protein
MRSILAIVLLGAAGGGGYYLWKHNGDVNKAAADVKRDLGGAVDQASGYPDAKTPKEAGDLFRKAIKERKYDMAARYCTDKYAEMLRKGDQGAAKFGEAIDNVSYQMSQRSVMTDEMKIVLFCLDPFPKDVSLTVSNETDKEAWVTIAPEGIRLTGSSHEFDAWKIDHQMFGTMYASLPPRVKAVKQGEVWKLDFPAPPVLQTSVTRLNDRYRTYVQKLEILTREIKNEADTKENVKKRMKELLEDAAKD